MFVFCMHLFCAIILSCSCIPINSSEGLQPRPHTNIGVPYAPLPHKITPIKTYSSSRKTSQTFNQTTQKAKLIFANQGIITPLIVDTHNCIIDGVLRYEIAKELGMETLQVIVVQNPGQEDITQLELSLNRLAEDSHWDQAVLKLKIEQLIEYNVDLTFTGFETAEIDNILSFEVVEPEDQDWTATDPVTQFGDIWRVGDHIIACGNALSPDEVLGDVLDSLELAKAGITDPPYNVPTSGHIRTTQKHAEFAMAAGEMDDQDFTEFLSRSITASLPYMDTTALYYLFMDWRHVGNLNAAAKYNGLIQQNLCVWGAVRQTSPSISIQLMAISTRSLKSATR